MKCLILVLLVVLPFFAGCAQVTAASVPTSTGSAPTIPPATSTAAPTTVPTETGVRPLVATVTARLPPVVTVAPPGRGSLGIRAVAAIPLGPGPSGELLFAVVSQGMRNFSTHQEQFVAIYARSVTGFRMLAQLELPSSDFIGPGALKQVHLDARQVWLQVSSGAGANSGCFDVLRFGGTALHGEAHQCLADPNRSALADIDGDGVTDVVLDQSDNLIFCHACGVTRFSFKVLDWNGSTMVPLNLTPLPVSAPADLRNPTNRAIQLARAGLWQEAEATIAPVSARTTAAKDPVLAADAGLIRLSAETFAKQAQNGPYPLLDNVYYGAYPAALNVMRPMTPAQIFNPQTPLVVGTVAHGFEKSLEKQLMTTTNQAIGAEPNLAAAYYLRGWAAYLANPKDPQVLSDVRRAAQLAPSDPLFTASVAFLQSGASSVGK
ncbi:MAG TPA: hypothetical protein VMW65_08990 [Chloroflexota bacterium]|nr:hypothetical protein [Chloroflexota bacterium]